MALLCLLTNTPWPWPTPAGAASARGGVPHPWNGAIAEWRGRSVAEVCTSEARKIRVPLVARQGRSPSGGLVTLLCAERRRALGWALRAGNRPAVEGGGRRVAAADREERSSSLQTRHGLQGPGGLEWE